ncbi:MAG: DNA-3-methyladenine glycosylase [Clostridiales bacterium]|nr:DNA-3-methyladenine glycosylase [Clostridiales bacterium]
MRQGVTAMGKLSRSFYLQDTLQAAALLPGHILVHKTAQGTTKGRIVEVEAYLGLEDRASHSYGGGQRERTRIQYEIGGHAYIYQIYGIHACMNVVTGPPGVPESILIRALEPVEGIDLMRRRRGVDDMRRLTDGPGKLCQAMGLTRDQYGADLCGDTLYLEAGYEGEDSPYDIVRSRRVNVDYAQEARDYLWRFSIRDHPYVSVKVN